MLTNDSFHIAVLPGDGIGPEVMAPALDVLRQIEATTPALKFRFSEAPAGADHYRTTGTALPESTIKIFDERAARQQSVRTEHIYIDACSAALVRRPWDFDVLVTENMFGDILSDLTAGLIGGMGMAPSADIGDRHAVFQPCHGTAPDIMGKGLANPAAMILSAAMMLDWLAERHDHASAEQAAHAIESAVDRAFAAGIVPCELGGRDGTAAIAAAVLRELDR